MKSESIVELAKALAKAQAEISHAHKDKTNPHFKSTYADLASCWDACRDPLSKNGLSVVQVVQQTEKGIMLETTLMHVSGEWIGGIAPIIAAKMDSQAVGSGITYMRRFALCALVGIAPADDDANAAVDQGKNDKEKVMIPPKTSVSVPVNLTAEKGSRIKNLLAGCGITLDYLQKVMIPRDFEGKTAIRQLTEAEFEKLERQLAALVDQEAYVKSVNDALVK